MEYRAFGATGLTVSAVGFGCARLGGVFGNAGWSGTLMTLRQALDAGITLYDTADLYAQGESERLVGAAFRGRREQVIIATKAGYRLPSQRKVAAFVKPVLQPLLRRAGLARRHVPAGVRGSLAQDFSPAYLIRAAEASLKRLNTDYIDIYQLHSPSAEVLERGEFIEPLERLKRAGKIRHYGVACETAGDVLGCLRYPGIASIQVGVSLLHQEALGDAIPRAGDRGIAVIARQCYASGQLAKPLMNLNLAEMIADADELEVRRRDIARYQDLADRAERSLPELALQFVLGVSGIAATLVGMRTDAHLADTLRFLERPLLPATVQSLKAPAAT